MIKEYIFLVVLFNLFIIVYLFFIYNKLNKKLTYVANNIYTQKAFIVKILSLLRNKYTTNVFTENSEIIYQDLLQYLIPIMTELEIIPRTSSEHPLWRSLGAIISESEKNLFIIEKLRRAIKNNENIAENVSNYITKSEQFLDYITKNDPNHILTSTFTDGLLGKSLSFFIQAKKLAENEQV